MSFIVRSPVFEMIFITMLLTAEHSNKCEGVFEGSFRGLVEWSYFDKNRIFC